MLVSVEVESCDRCPHSIVTSVLTSDPFDNVREVECIKLNETIYRYLDWNEMAAIPDNCPFKER